MKNSGDSVSYRIVKIKKFTAPAERAKPKKAVKKTRPESGEKMKAAVYYSNSDVRHVEMPKPRISKGEILMKVMASGICGSDVMEWYRKKNAPLVLGHEVVGEVVEVGDGIENFKPGDRIFTTHHVPCYKCRYCKSGSETVCDMMRTTKFYPGGFAQYLRIPAENVENGTFLLPPEISWEEGTFIEPLACVVRGQRKAGVKGGQTVLVLGSGISGLLHIQLARSRGAKVIATDIDEYKLRAASRLGAHVTLNATRDDVPAEVLKRNGKRLADRVIVCTGARSAVEQALRCVDRGGTILFFAPTDPGVQIPIKVDELWKNGISLITSYAAARQDIKQAMSIIKAKKINVHAMITHRMGLADTGQGFKLMTSKGRAIKVIIRPHA
jgi:L-iditol 2-dehydrogenase